MYKWQRIKALHAQGAGIRQIARTVGVSRNTVRKYLKEASPPQFKAREYVKELDRYLEEIKIMLAKGYIGTRIYNELVDKGYQGSLASVHRYLRSIKEDDRAAKLATTRVETGPGQQMQYDWKVWTLPVDGKPVTKEQANLLFRMVSMRYEKGSIILTSNYNFNEWGEIFSDQVVAAAIIDRLVHHARIFYINGTSYRLKGKLKVANDR